MLTVDGFVTISCACTASAVGMESFSNDNEGSTKNVANKRQKNGHGFDFSSEASQHHEEEEDPFLVLVPEKVLHTTTTTAAAAADAMDDGDGDSDVDGQSSPSLKYLPLPNKLAYPFWYDPHPIAKWAANQLKAELPPYDKNTTSKTNASETTPAITLGKMYGVLVVNLDEDENNATTTDQAPRNLGYLQAYSGTMPRPQYGGSSVIIPDPNGKRFVPPIYDRFAKGSRTEDGDDFDYERDEDLLNALTEVIDHLEICPERQKQKVRWKETEARLLSDISGAKQLQKQNKKSRKARRRVLRDTLLANDNESQCKEFMSDREAHTCFLEYNDEYRALEDKLVQESALDQRQFKAVKASIETELETVRSALADHHSQIEALKQKRKEGSNDLHRNLFGRYKLLNAAGETKIPSEIFADTPLGVPPAGTGDCAAPKLFQHAFSKGYRPVALAEFWWGPSPHTSDNDVARTHGNYYPCCRGKCEPILTRHMLVGTDVESSPLTEGVPNSDSNPDSKSNSNSQGERTLSIVYEDEWLVVVNKPHDVLSVPGRTVQDSIKNDLQTRYPNATGPLLVHRLDYSTSGLLLAAKDSDTHKALQAQFIERTVKKRYEALLEGNLGRKSGENQNKKRGKIDLPLAGDYLNRPMQKVERGPEGKPSVTHYEIVEDDSSGGESQNPGVTQESPPSRTRVYFYPQTGRTHQLRVHASHPEGLGMAIVGDDIYGQFDKRLCLHAGWLQIEHPHTRQRVTFTAPVPF